jgi:hypothetical protein
VLVAHDLVAQVARQMRAQPRPALVAERALVGGIVEVHRRRIMVQSRIVARRGGTMSIRQLLDLSGRTALVTGGSRGLGLQIAEALGELGARVALVARKQDELDVAVAHLASTWCIHAVPLACDLAQPAAIQRWSTRRRPRSAVRSTSWSTTPARRGARRPPSFRSLPGRRSST